jgi:hypothetical protein
VLTVTLLVGAALPAPDIVSVRRQSIPLKAKEPDENQAAQ